MADAFKKEQDAWSLQLVTDPELSDAVAVLGQEAKRVPFVGALLGSVSEPLKKALKGDFQEGRTRELVLAHVAPEAFECILRAAAHLDPGLNPENVVPTLKAAQLYMITKLADECVRYMKDEVKSGDILTVLSACVDVDVTLPEDVETELWSSVLLHSAQVLGAPSFLHAHGSLIYRLIRLDEFGVSENELWSRLVAWAQNAQQNPKQLGPFGATEEELPPPGKRARTSVESKSSVGLLVEPGAVLRQLSKHVRFAAMDKVFFCDNARPYLDKDRSDAVFMYHLLGRAEMLETSMRPGLCPPEQQVQIETSNLQGSPEVSKLASGGAWRPARPGEFIQIRFPSPVVVTKVRLLFAAQGSLWPRWIVAYCGKDMPTRPLLQRSLKRGVENLNGDLANHGRTLTVEISNPGVQLKAIRTRPAGVQENWEQYAFLQKVEVFGRVGRMQDAREVAARRFEELRLQPASGCDS